MGGKEGFLYAVGLKNGEVKIGRTNQHPKIRLSQYKREGYIEGNHYVTEYRLIDVKAGEKKVILALGEHLSRGREYFSCSLDEAICAINNVYEDSEKHTSQLKPGLEQRSIGLADATWKWLEKKAQEETRSVVQQIRHYLDKLRREDEK